MSNPRLILNTIFRRGLDNQQHVLVQKCVERPSQPSRIEFFEPLPTEPAPVTTSPTSVSPPGGLRSSFPFFQNRKQETCFNRANLFGMPSRTASLPPTLFPSHSNNSNNNNNDNNNNSEGESSSSNDGSKNKLKRSIATAGLFSFAAVVTTDEDDGLVKGAPWFHSYVVKKAKCAYENARPPPMTTRSLPNLNSASTPASTKSGYVNNYDLRDWTGEFQSITENTPGLERGERLRKLSEEFLNSTSAKSSVVSRDWTGEFQSIMENAPRLERGELLRQLSEEFVEAATQIGRVIIRERNLPIMEKTVLPLSGRGVAGGEKFIQNSIFFKYAIDSHQLYGGNDEHAMKVAGHELKGGTALMSCGMMLGLNFGLMCLIDYRGYRLIATSSLPISPDTIVYGSCDGGHTVHAENPEMNAVMEKCFKILNLKGHTAGIGSSTKFMYGPCDIEGHLGRDGKFYVVDVARIWPPETPNASLPGSFLYKLLRPELVSRYPKALSSDAFSLFGKNNSAEHDAEVVEATRFLINKAIPDFAEVLSRLDDSELEHSRVVKELHRAGINTRHLGRVRALIPNDKTRIRDIILEELICRVLKNGFRLQMRKLVSSDDSDYEALTSDFFNHVFCELSDSKRFWEVDVRAALQTRFPHCLSEDELNVQNDLRASLDLQLVYRRLQEMTGVKFLSDTYHPKMPFNADDVEGIQVIEKHMYATPRIEADTAAELARQKSGVEAETLLGVAIEKYNSVLELKTDDYVVLSNLGNVLAELAKMKAASHHTEEADNLFKQSSSKFELCSQMRPDDFKTWLAWGDTISSHLTLKLSVSSSPSTSPDSTKEIEALYEGAQQKYAKAYRLNPLHPSTLFNWANLNYTVARLKMSHSETELAEQMLVGSESLYKQCYSYKQDDPDVLINWGCLLLRLSKLKLNQGQEENSSSSSASASPFPSPAPFASTATTTATATSLFSPSSQVLPARFPSQKKDRGLELLEQAKEKFLEAEQLSPSIGTFNIACVCALLRQEEECRHWIIRCLAHSGLRSESLTEDEDLSIYRKKEWFVSLVEDYRRKEKGATV